MTVLVDTSVLIDCLRDHQPAVDLLQHERSLGVLHATEMTRLEILAGMRPGEESATRALLSALIWYPVDEAVAEQAGVLGRRWVPSHHTIDGADLAVAATTMRLSARLLTLNVRHFPLFDGSRPPY